MLLLAAAVYAGMAVGRSTMPARQSGTRCLMNLEILTVLIVLNGSRKQFSLAATSLTCALEVIFYNEMRYINLRFTYLLTYRSEYTGRSENTHSCPHKVDVLLHILRGKMALCGHL